MRRARDEQGVAALELALTLPLLLLMLLGVGDVASLLRNRAQLQEAAQEAVSFAARNPSRPEEAQQRAVDAATPIDISTSDVTITCTTSGTTRRVTVTITHDNPTVFVNGGDGPTIEVSLISDVLSTEECTQT